MKKSNIQGIKLKADIWKADIWKADIWNYGIGFETKSHRSGSNKLSEIIQQRLFVFEISAHFICF